MSGVNVNAARAAWGAAIPAWVLALAQEADRTSQSAAARRIGLSVSTINRVLSASYAGRMDRIADAVRPALMPAITCPHDGAALSAEGCAERRGYRPTNTAKVHQLRTCAACGEWVAGGAP